MTHPDREALLAFADGDDLFGFAAIADHVRLCAECQAMLDEMRGLLRLVGDEDVQAYLHGDFAEQRQALRTKIVVAAEQTDRRPSRLADLVTELLAVPSDAWEAVLARKGKHWSVGIVQYLNARVEEALNRRPEEALQALVFVERIATYLPTTEQQFLLADVWKHRSNAHRHLGHYEEAINAADRSCALYDAVSSGTFDAAQARYTRAAALFKMLRFREARDDLAAATTALRDYGESIALAKVIMLEAGILIEEGFVSEAERLWLDVIPILERFQQHIELARVHANLAECYLRQGDADRALPPAREARRRYHDLGMDVEWIRAEWTIGVIRLAQGYDAVDELHGVAAAFDALGMTGDAGFVRLDIAEELVRRTDWAEAEPLARELADLFARAGVTAASMQALDYLRMAVERREATVAFVQYVREYISIDDPARRFAPPLNQ